MENNDIGTNGSISLVLVQEDSTGEMGSLQINHRAEKSCICTYSANWGGAYLIYLVNSYDEDSKTTLNPKNYIVFDTLAKMQKAGVD